MLKKSFKVGLAIVKHLAIAFLFSFVLVAMVYGFTHEKLEVYLSLISKMTVATLKEENKDIQIDEIDKRLVSYPSYGTPFGTVKIPKIGVEATLYHGDSMEIIKNNIGHYEGSYFPGEGGSIILAAHNSKQHFMYLPKLVSGDKVTIDTIYGTFNYEVTSHKIIQDNDMDSLPIQSDKELLMMYTCWPIGVPGFKSQRYLVYAERVGE